MNQEMKVGNDLGSKIHSEERGGNKVYLVRHRNSMHNPITLLPPRALPDWIEGRYLHYCVRGSAGVQAGGQWEDLLYALSRSPNPRDQEQLERLERQTIEKPYPYFSLFFKSFDPFWFRRWYYIAFSPTFSLEYGLSRQGAERFQTREEAEFMLKAAQMQVQGEWSYTFSIEEVEELEASASATKEHAA
jgi:hypothetical protein